METKCNFKSVYQFWDEYQSWFIFSEDTLVSCRLCIWDGTPKEAVISDLFVNEYARKEGRATAILNHCFEFSKLRGCDSVSLRSDNADWVRDWYKRLGFEVESSQVWLKKSI